MKYQNIRKKTEGFTIIEVLIVLAIAGLILLIVFLAVPALQRNSRNTQAKNEASAILGAANEVSANNGGKPLTANNAAAILAASNAKNVTNVVVEAESASTAPSTTVAVLKLNAKCAATLPGAALTTDVTVPGTSSRQYALVYQIETSAAAVATCQEG